jgi:hypothetical protein
MTLAQTYYSSIFIFVQSLMLYLAPRLQTTGIGQVREVSGLPACQPVHTNQRNPCGSREAKHKHNASEKGAFLNGGTGTGAEEDHGDNLAA